MACLPLDSGYEVAFAGRSNAGKSSAINSITNQKTLARVSKTPGRTQHINFFELDPERRLVDLPGYGYAKVAHSVKEQWQQTLTVYLDTRQSLRGLVIVMDSRHPLTSFDQHMLDACQHARLPTHILLTKADKLSKGAAGAVLQQVRRALAERYRAEDAPLPTVQLFSALRNIGIEDAHHTLDQWFNLKTTMGPDTEHPQK